VIEDLLAQAREALGMSMGYVAEFTAGHQVTRHLTGEAASFGQHEGAALALEGTYCRRMVDGELPSAVPDTAADERVRDLAVTHDAGIGAYIGVPVLLPDGALYGTLCCLDHEPAELRERDVRFLRVIGRLVGRALADRRAAREGAEARAHLSRSLRDSRRQLQSILDHGPSVIFVKGLTGRYLLVNREYERLFAVAHDEVVGLTDHELFPREVADRLVARDRAVLEAGEARTEEEVIPVAGVPRTYMATKFPLRDDDGEAYAVCAIATDITERKRVEKDLRASEQRTRAILENAQEAFVSITEDGTITEWNPQAEVTFGWTRAEALGRQVGDLIIPARMRGAHAAGLRRVHDTARSTIVGRRIELSALHRDGHELPIEITTSATRSDEGVAFHAFIHDATARKQAQDALAHQALHDPLTGLPNRTLLLDRLTLALGRARRDASRCAVLFVDVDNFKTVNDSLGHDRGDELLVELGQRLSGVVRVVDTVARFGGDEFVLLAEGVEADRCALELAQRVLDVFERPFTVAGQELVVGGSVGIALADAACERAEDAVRDADAAMYRAKRRGRGGFELFDEQLREDVVRRLRVERDLRRALDVGELFNVYQPIIDLRTGRALAVEALVRWEHPSDGLVSPGDFIPVAEESGLVGRLGEQVLRRACRDVAPWGDLEVSVNVSARQLTDPSLPGKVAAALRDAGLPARRLVLELTESALMTDDAVVERTLEGLQALGVRLSLDDFGTGYSSLSYLHTLPVRTLKLDRSFIGRITEDPRARALVGAVVQLADGLGLKVVAEGIETPEQGRALAALGAAYAQGFLFSRPVGADALAARLGPSGAWHAPDWPCVGS